MYVQIKTQDTFFLEYMEECAAKRGDVFVFSSTNRFCDIVVPYLLHETNIPRSEMEGVREQLISWMNDASVFYKDAFVTFALARYPRNDIWTKNLDVLTDLFQRHPLASSILSVTITPAMYTVTGAKGVHAVRHNQTEQDEDDILLYLLQNPAKQLILQEKGYGFGREMKEVLFHLYQQRLHIF